MGISKNRLEFQILAALIIIFLLCVLPCDIYAQTLHNQTLDVIEKQTNVFAGNPQINVGINPGG